VLLNKWLMDELYDAMFVNPVKSGARLLYRAFDLLIVDGVVNGVGSLVRATGRGLRPAQTGGVQNYAAIMVAALLVIAIVALAPWL